MLRFAAGRVLGGLRTAAGLQQGSKQSMVGAAGMVVRASHSNETDEEFDARYEAYFSRPELDGWEARKAMNDLLGMDLVPEPKIIISALKACRRLNDYALAIRFLEGVKDKCGDKTSEIYPYLLQEIRPTLTDLGIDTPEELGYDQPELALKSVYDLH
ncbi:cytochrome c oxidase subunit 5A, mitochondrial [Anopheles aquasalis]|uniref:Cytochrome c oxidase subunit 5A, mitochondrial n=1 Tax=Anopheles aquasalis TaxID=42839 RepID=T1DER5_ANOAQ|nr:cytochrome c oxidase subunit 5A, mitochondrial [Anopheles aquasalis]